ncbi:TIGR01777 family oxidoreductase [Sulfurimonas sp. HSL3-7]|uniref:TIGR01777 family oxidoreductase n=1 Tax=Sulfonitrofixus jiaomeiensis TaxID=3131938 RepID=UPI0031F8BC1A
MKIALTGASGFVGAALQKTFDDCVIIARDDDEAAILKKLKAVDVVINLAGAPIIKRWSDPYKKVLLESRIATTRKLVRAINQSGVKHFISTSAIGIYPDGLRCDELTTEIAGDFLGMLAREWEVEALACHKPTTILRFGVILGPDGGALAQMLTPFRLGVGGIIGNGRMMTSWIDIGDLMKIYRFVIERHLSGIFNAVSPNPVTNYVFTKTLGGVLHRPTILPIPEFALRIMYGEAASVLTGSKEVYPRALTEAGFAFDYPNLESSLKHLLG